MDHPTTGGAVGHKTTELQETNYADHANLPSREKLVWRSILRRATTDLVASLWSLNRQKVFNLIGLAQICSKECLFGKGVDCKSNRVQAKESSGLP